MPTVKPRKRPVQSRARATVEAIKEAAARILGEGGIDAISTNAVAERAGVSVGSLYQYYPNREAILVDLLRAKVTILATAIEQATDNPSLECAMHAMLRAMAKSYLNQPAVAVALVYVETLIGDDEDIAIQRARISGSVVTFLIRNNAPNPHLAARDIAALARGMALSAGLSGERDVDALVGRMTRAVRGYLGWHIV